MSISKKNHSSGKRNKKRARKLKNMIKRLSEKEEREVRKMLATGEVDG